MDVHEGAERGGTGNFSTSAVDLLSSKEATTAPREQEVEQQGNAGRPQDPHHHALVSNNSTHGTNRAKRSLSPLALISPCFHSLAHGCHCSAWPPPHVSAAFKASQPPDPGVSSSPRLVVKAGSLLSSLHGGCPSALPCPEPAHTCTTQTPCVMGTLGTIWGKKKGPIPVGQQQ